MTNKPEDDTQSNPEISPLREEYSNAKKRLERQRNVLDAFAKEGRQTLRIILVLIGVLFSAVTVLSPQLGLTQTISSSCSIYLLPNQCLSIFWLLIISGLGLTVSAICHGTIGTEARAIGSIGTPDDIESVLISENIDGTTYLSERLESYQKRIERNNGVIRSLETVLAVGKLAILFGIVGLTVAGVAIIVGPITWYVTVLLMILFTLSVLLLGRTMPDEYIKQDYAISNSGTLSVLFLTDDSKQKQD